MTTQQICQLFQEIEAYVAEGHNCSHTIDWLRDKCAATCASYPESAPDRFENSPEVIDGIDNPFASDLPPTVPLEEVHEGSAS